MNNKNNNNNNCNRSNKKGTLSYNHHFSSYYSIVSISSSALLFLSLLFLPAAATANFPMSNVANASAAQQQQLLIESSSLRTNSSNNNNTMIPTAQSVYTSQSMTLPRSVGTFIWYIVDEAHENTHTSLHKKISDHNPDYLPTNLVISQGTAISFLDADAPWDSPHPHTINILDSSGKVVYSTGKMDYTNSSTPKVLPSGKYTVMDTKYIWMKGNLTVTAQSRSSSGGNLVVGGFYTPTNQVANNKDNDGGVHPGWLGYYKTEFPKNGFKILSQYNFHYATCKYCPGGYWPDQKTGDHTLIIYSTSQPVSNALYKLSKLVWNNVYI